MVIPQPHSTLLAIKKVSGRSCAKIDTNKSEASGNLLNGQVQMGRFRLVCITSDYLLT